MSRFGGGRVDVQMSVPPGTYVPTENIPWVDPTNAFGDLSAIGDGEAHYLNEFFGVQGDFEAAFPLAFNVFVNWLKRNTRTKPGGVNDPHATIGHWSNLTIDWAALTEAFEGGGYIVCPKLEYVTSDTLLVRKFGTTVDFLGSIYQTRGGSRGNMLAIGEGHDLTWRGGEFYGQDALGDNCITLFQNQITTALAGWETINARRTIVRDVRCFDIIRDATYGGGKAVSVQNGAHGGIVSGVHSLGCDMGVTVEGKASSVALVGPDPAEAYNAVGFAISDCVIEDAALCGWYGNNASNVDDPLANSVIATNMVFINCASNNPDMGAICGDRAANTKMSALVVSTLTDQITPVRGTWLEGTDLDVTVNAHDVYSLIDTRHPVGEGSNAVGCKGATIRVNAKIRANTSTFLIKRSSGTDGNAPIPDQCSFDITVKGYESAGAQLTAISDVVLPTSVLTKVTSFNPAIAPSTNTAVGTIEQAGSGIAIPYTGVQQQIEVVERGNFQGLANQGANVNIRGKYAGKRVSVTNFGPATSLGTSAPSQWVLQVMGIPPGTLSASTASPTVTGSTVPAITRFSNTLVVGDTLFAIVGGMYVLLGTILSIESATSLTLTANALATVTDQTYSFTDTPVPFALVVSPV